MKFGLYAPVPHVTIGSDPIRRAIHSALQPLPAGAVDPQYELSKEVLLAADEAGFDIILFAERHRGPDLEAWVLASAMSALTKRITSMVAVHPGLWHPTLIAKMAWTLDRITLGRSAINVMTGWNVDEARMFGGDILLENNDRYIRAEEFVDILRGMWAKSPFSYKGRFYDVLEAELLLRPAGHLEVFAASRSPRGLDMVARSADWWFVDFDLTSTSTAQVLEAIKRSIGDMRDRAAKAGRTVRIAFNPYVGFGQTKEAAITEARGLLALEDPTEKRKIEARLAPAMVTGCLGPPEAVRQQLWCYAELGIDLFLFKFVPTPENVVAIRDEIITPMRRSS